jgi:hypothetical protein
MWLIFIRKTINGRETGRDAVSTATAADRADKSYSFEKDDRE